MDHCVVGLDIGGTEVKSALLLNTAGDIVRKAEIDTCHASGHGRFIASLYNYIGILRQGCRIDVLGVGVAGIFDPDRTTLLEAPNMPGLRCVPLRRTSGRASAVPRHP